MKRTNAGAGLLTMLGAGTHVPLFVTEGSWQQKRRAIRMSDYLEFAYRTLADTAGPIVVSAKPSATPTVTSSRP